MRRPYVSARASFGAALGVASLVSIGLYVAGFWTGSSRTAAYLPWNLLLAWISLLAALLLERTIHRSLWSSWPALAATAVWLLLLPNAFYMVSDLVHLLEVSGDTVLFDAVMFASFAINGMILGVSGLFIAHWELTKRVPALMAYKMVGIVLLACSYGIYVGRELRWNTWDLLAHPASVLFDVSDRLINFRSHPRMLVTTASFFLLLGSTYLMVWYAARVARTYRSS